VDRRRASAAQWFAALLLLRGRLGISRDAEGFEEAAHALLFG
jgi:hypothetical protein